jgi:glycosyltransferase involved in cell wall biosynthesis
VASPLAIALDASLWDDPTTGIGLYARCLSEALERLGVGVRHVGARTSGDAPRGQLGATHFTLAKLPGILAEGVEPLFHAVGNFNLPLQRIPGKRLVLTVHDLIPLLLPQTVSAAYRWQFRVWLARSIRVADRIICVSARTRADLLARYPMSPEKVAVVHHGVDHVDAVPAPDETSEVFLRTLALPQDFVLYAGSLDARKNVSRLLDATERLHRQGRSITLVLMGQRWFGSNEVEKRLASVRAAGCDVRLLEHQTAPIFYALMRRAAVFVVPSLYEGFGLPPLEAMRLGVPVIASDRGALPEICGDAAAFVSPEDPEQIAQAIDAWLRAPEERRRRAATGKRHAAAFTWERAARQTVEVYRAALSSAEAA